MLYLKFRLQNTVDIGVLKKSLGKINLKILRWPCIRFLSFTLIFLSSSILYNSVSLKVLLVNFHAIEEEWEAKALSLGTPDVKE